MSIKKYFSLFSCIIILLVAFAVPPLLILQISTTHAQAQPSFHATLNHVDHGKGLTKRELLQRSLERGRKRQQRLMGCGGSNTFETAIRDADGGDYLMNFSIGTPTPFPITAIMDTGSHLTWTQCQPCQPCFNQSMSIFDPRNSLSYSKLKCSTKRCKALFPPGHVPPCMGHYCSYDFVYGNNATILGVIATDTFTFGEDLKVPNLLFGCTLKSNGNFLGGSGIFGLGRSKLSIVYQMNEPEFSYCLPTYSSDAPGFLKMGGGGGSNIVSTTPLITNPTKHHVYYYISLQGITIGQTRLKNIDNSTFAIKQEDGSGGMIIDSGTTITYLRQTAFDQVENELTRQVIGLKINGSEIGLDLCFDITKTLKKKKGIYNLPAFVLHFQNGVDLKLTQNNTYTFFGDSDDPKKRYVCLMMAGSWLDSSMSILGNYQLQKTLVTYDLAQEKLSFLPNCGGYHA